MAQWWKTVVTVGAGALALSGCGRSESCEKGRMSLDRMWDGVQTQAVKLKLASTEGSGPTASIWGGIEADIELLQSSFATEQITWDSAKKKLNRLQQAIQDLGAQPTSAFQSFRDSISRAATMQADLEKSCRY